MDSYPYTLYTGPDYDPRDIDTPPPERMDSDEYDSRLVIAAKEGNVDLMNQLLSEGIDPSLNHNAAILEATKNDKPEVVIALLDDERTDPTDDVDPDLYEGVFFTWIYRGNVEVVRKLLANPHLKPEFCGDRISYMMAFEGNKKMEDLLRSDSRIGKKLAWRN